MCNIDVITLMDSFIKHPLTNRGKEVSLNLDKVSISTLVSRESTLVMNVREGNRIVDIVLFSNGQYKEAIKKLKSWLMKYGEEKKKEEYVGVLESLAST